LIVLYNSEVLVESFFRPENAKDLYVLSAVVYYKRGTNIRKRETLISSERALKGIFIISDLSTKYIRLGCIILVELYALRERIA